ncbi:MAG: MFS transporter [Nitrosopumilales archaeon]|nr:MFS transporter [Nitrosopumilales archaeon]
MLYSFQWISKDGRLLLTARILRTFAYGFLSIVISIYLKLIGFDGFLIGLILTSTLINSVIFTLVASFYADRIGRRKMLVIYAIMMAISGVIFFVTSNYIALIVAGLIGTINVTGTETGAFLSIEQAVLPQTVKDTKKRNTLFAFYNMVGTFAMSAGVLVSGLPEIIQHQYGLNQIDSIRLLFLAYSILGIGVLGIYLSLSKRVEIMQGRQGGGEDQDEKRIPKPLTQTLSPTSKKIVAKLSGLFAIDSFGGGFVIQSIVSLWFFTKFGADLTLLSYIFSIAGVLTAFSFLASAKIADRIGLINTMVFTHLPSNILLILVAFSPTLPIAIAFYLARMALSQMDVPTRQSYIVAVVKEDERTAAAGITNISRNITQAISPSIAGSILQSVSLLFAPFLLGGLLKIVYDIALYLQFKRDDIKD